MARHGEARHGEARPGTAQRGTAQPQTTAPRNGCGGLRQIGGSKNETTTKENNMKVREKNRIEGLQSNGSIQQREVKIAAPDIREALFEVRGTAPLVIHRFSAKTKAMLKGKMEAGKSAGSKKNREAKLTDDAYEESRYISKDGWDGFHAGAIRCGMISACRLVDFKMTLAKLSIFVVADGWDAKEPQIPLIRIYGSPTKQEDIGRVETGAPYVTVRAAYHDWKAKILIRWDNDQFSLQDITNLLSRVGQQVGIGEGRHDSKKSAGMSWGTFEIARNATAK